MRVAVMASGQGSNLQAILDHSRAGNLQADITLAVSDKAASPALERARKAGVEAIALPPGAGETRHAYDARLVDALRTAQPDLVVLAGFMRILGPQVLAAFPERVLNIHPSLLPAFRGLDAVGQAHAAGAAFAGCTTHIVNEDLDGGPIILQAAVAIRPTEEIAQLCRRVLALEHLLLPRTIDLWSQGRITVEGRRTRIARPPSGDDSWLRRPGIELMSGALYGEGF